MFCYLSQAIIPHTTPAPVYNLEILGPHVYRVSQLALLVHNASFGANQSSSQLSRPNIRNNDLTTMSDFKNRSVVGDNLEPHELLQHAWLKTHGHATTRLSTSLSKNNPVIALKRPTHQVINSSQIGMEVANQTAIENILANRRIMLELGFSKNRVNKLTAKAIKHAKENNL